VSHEIRLLGVLGSEFERLAAAPQRRRRFVAWRWRPLALVFALVLGGTAGALAATGVILTGSPVPPTGPVVATAGSGIPAAGGSRLLPLRVADPGGGLPWGMRVIHTTRGRICVQVGRVYRGQLGELGIDGAFDDDGRFHVLAPDILGAFLGDGNRAGIVDCENPGRTFAAYAVGFEANAATAPATGGLATRREISFGVLGPDALSITYSTATGKSERSLRVVPGVGAYLIVQRYSYARRLLGLGERLPPQLPSAKPVRLDRPTPGLVSYSDALGSQAGRLSSPAGPNGAVTAITYRYGHTECTDRGLVRENMIRACGLAEGPPPTPAPLPAGHQQLHIRLVITNHRISGGVVSFTAPYSVKNASEGFTAVVRAGRVVIGLGITNADIAQGTKVTIPLHLDCVIARPPASCLQPAKPLIAIAYYDRANTLSNTIIGTARVQLPAGDH
jgi:hypothetical protein